MLEIYYGSMWNDSNKNRVFKSTPKNTVTNVFHCFELPNDSLMI